MYEEQELTFTEDEAPLELGIQMLEEMDAPFWATGAGVVVGATIVGAFAYT
jgi:hypothetical protein